LKFNVDDLEAVWFNVPSPPLKLREGPGVSYDITYTVDQNTWNGSTKLQLIVKEVSPSLSRPEHVEGD